LSRDYAIMPITVNYNCPALRARAVRTIDALKQTFGKRR
jgi:hypothetical protein